MTEVSTTYQTAKALEDKDAAMRIWKLKDIEAGMVAEQKAIARRLDDSDMAAFVVGLVVALVVATWMPALLPAAPLLTWLAASASICVPLVGVTYVIMDKMKKFTAESVKPRSEYLAGHKKVVAGAIDKILNQDLVGVSRSAKCEGLFKSYPDVKAQYADAARKSIVAAAKTPSVQDKPEI